MTALRLSRPVLWTTRTSPLARARPFTTALAQPRKRSSEGDNELTADKGFRRVLAAIRRKTEAGKGKGEAKTQGKAHTRPSSPKKSKAKEDVGASNGRLTADQGRAKILAAIQGNSAGSKVDSKVGSKARTESKAKKKANASGARLTAEQGRLRILTAIQGNAAGNKVLGSTVKSKSEPATKFRTPGKWADREADADDLRNAAGQGFAQLLAAIQRKSPSSKNSKKSETKTNVGTLTRQTLQEAGKSEVKPTANRGRNQLFHTMTGETEFEGEKQAGLKRGADDNVEMPPTKEAGIKAGQLESKGAGDESGNQTRTEPGHESGKQASAQAGNGASKQTGKQSGRQAGRQAGKQRSTKKTKREKNTTVGSAEQVLQLDADAVRAKHADSYVLGPDGLPLPEDLPEHDTEVDVDVLDVSSTGDGLAMRKGSSQVYVVPFAVAGDVVRVKVYRHVLDMQQTVADLVSVTKPGPTRDDSRIRCRYFGACGGCQFQMLDYAEQLALKKRTVEKAFRNFSDLAPELVPAVGDTIGSPLQYGYRTKLTPHFDGPPGCMRRRGKDANVRHTSRPAVGFMHKATRRTIDIEDCPIGTDVVRLGMKAERERMDKEFAKYPLGATILLRESTKRIPKTTSGGGGGGSGNISGNGEASGAADKMDEDLPGEKDDATKTAAAIPEAETVRVETDDHVDVKSCITDHKATSTEYIDSFVFTNPAGSFFQNNNSILPSFTSYIRDHILPPGSPPSATTATTATTATAESAPADLGHPPIKYLIDAYSGSGLFTITLSSQFAHSTGIDIAADSIACASRNARLNGLDAQARCAFIPADARALFDSVSYPPDQTVAVLDPPRKGCDAQFLDQLRRFGPRRVVYVSCNVHTQARDVGVLVRGEGPGATYEVESLRGFDFFPQTAHVEGVAILNRVDEPAKTA